MKILHLYHDLMNLYGDYANITVLKKLLENNGQTVTVDRVRPNEEIDFGEYDFVYIGSGTERNMKAAMDDFRRLKDDFVRYIGSGGVALLTGNSFEMLGKSVTDADGAEHEGLGLFGFTVTEQNKTRLVGDAVFDCGFLDSPLVGFVNKCSEISGIDEPMFTVRMGLGNREGDKGEGVRMNDLFCTHLTGPVLVKNPRFLCYIASLLLGHEADDSCLVYEKKGYEITLRELENRIAAG